MGLQGSPHWASPLIGEPWTPEHNCWWLVRMVFDARHGISMPEVAVGTDENVAAICQAAHQSGWRMANGKPDDADIVLMRDPKGMRHVGVMIDTMHGLKLLHSSGYLDDDGKPHGSVVAQSLDYLVNVGHTDIELWRATK